MSRPDGAEQVSAAVNRTVDQPAVLHSQPATRAMSDSHYDRICRRIRKEIKGTHVASLWIALALAAIGIAGALLTAAYASGGLSSGTQITLKAIGWCSVVLAASFVFVHFKVWTSADVRADDVIDELGSYMFEVGPSEGEPPK